MQDSWTTRKFKEIQRYANRNESKNFSTAVKAIYSPPTQGTVPHISSDGTTLLTEKSQILKHWAAHSKNVLNRSYMISKAPTGRLSQVKISVDLDLPTSLPETIRVMQQLSSGIRRNPRRNLQARRPPPD
ncbi:hypothetical protein SprV_0501887900 [Sparganum proliferum]